MRFNCRVEVFNRLCASTSHVRQRRNFSTLTVGGYGSSTFGGKLWILHQTAHNGKGERYKVNSNIIGLFTKFVHEGKVTVRLREPAFDLKIMGERRDLVQFVELIRSFCTGKPPDPSMKIKITNLGTVPKKLEPPPQKTLVVSPCCLHSGRSYPSTIEHLIVSQEPIIVQYSWCRKVNDLRMEKIDPKIFRLQHLRELNLEGNQIRRVPKSIDLLSGLRVLSLSGNKLGLSTKEEHWEWLRSESLGASLEMLNLGDNELTVLPNCLPHLRSLMCLSVNDNKLRRLPNNIGFAKSLKTLFLKNNPLRWLPSSLLTCGLDCLDLSETQFSEPINSSEESTAICLKDMAARVVLKHKLKYNDTILPRELIRYLESSCFCLCGKATFPEHPSDFQVMDSSVFSNNVIYGETQGTNVNVGFRKCLVTCSRTKTRLEREVVDNI